MKGSRISRLLLLAALGAAASSILAAELSEAQSVKPSYMKVTPISIDQASFRLYRDISSMEKKENGSRGVLGTASKFVSDRAIQRIIAKSAEVSEVDLLEFVRSTGKNDFLLERLRKFCVQPDGGPAQSANSQ